MKKASQNYQGRESTPFMKIKEASQVTGLSVYFINVPRLMEKLNAAENEVVQ